MNPSIENVYPVSHLSKTIVTGLFCWGRSQPGSSVIWSLVLPTPSSWSQWPSTCHTLPWTRSSARSPRSTFWRMISTLLTITTRAFSTRNPWQLFKKIQKKYFFVEKRNFLVKFPFQVNLLFSTTQDMWISKAWRHLTSKIIFWIIYILLIS